MSRARCVLVVDDDADVREALSEVLMEEDCLVLQACNGAEALRIVANVRPDLILLDLMMPEVSGWEVLDRLAQDPRLDGVPVALLTACPPDWAPSGAYIVAKPLDLSAVLRLLDAIDAPASVRHVALSMAPTG